MPQIQDMFLLSVPWSDIEIAECGPAVLKGIAESFGYSVKTHDISLDLYHKICKSNPVIYGELQEYFVSSYDENFEYQNLIEQFYEHVLTLIQDTPCRFLGISVFSVWRQKATFELLTRIKKKFPDQKISLGGRGLSIRHHQSIDHYLTSGEKIINFSEIIVKRKLADHLLIGDSEDSIIDLLENNYSDNQLTPMVVKNKKLDYPFSNYDDAKFECYKGIAGRSQLSVISSKGCVRDCDFCDVGAQFKRFSFKSGAKLAEEMIYLANRYKIYEITLADSIANGNLKSLKEMCFYLTVYNKTANDNEKIKWSGNWIARMPGTLKKDFFNLIKESGCIHVTIGAESGSNHVLESMNKKATVEGLYYELENFDKCGIKTSLNNITGHWSEEFMHFEEHVEMLLTLGPLYAKDTVNSIKMNIFSVLQDTPAALNHEYNGIHVAEENFTTQWYTKKNPSLTIQARLARLIILYTMFLDYKIPVDNSYAVLINLLNNLQATKNKWSHFYKNNLDFDNYFVCKSIEKLDNISFFIKEKTKKLFPGTKLLINFYSSHCNGAPEFFIKYNGKQIYKQKTSVGQNQIELYIDYNYDEKNKLEFGMSNKQSQDTKVDHNGIIIEDKNITIDSIYIDTINLMSDSQYFYHQSRYYEEEVLLSETKPGFWKNGYIMFEWIGPLWVDYLRNKNKSKWIGFGENNHEEKIQSLLDVLRQTVKQLEYR